MVLRLVSLLTHIYVDHQKQLEENSPFTNNNYKYTHIISQLVIYQIKHL